MAFRSLQGFGSILLALGLSANAFATNFFGVGGAIPDNNPAGINITFDTRGIPHGVGDLKLTLNINQTYVRDLKATLYSPSGIARLVIFSRVGRRTTAPGGSANLAGSYTFSDFGSDLWGTASPLATAADIPPGIYRTSTQGAELSTGATNDGGGCYTSLSGAFAGLSTSDINGFWTLNVADVQGGDVGTVNSATLSIEPVADAIYRNGFEIAPRGTCKLAREDFTGRGRTSYAMLRNTGGGIGGAMTWFVKDNDSAAGGVETSFVHGISGDKFVQGDWDGDGLADAALWRPGSPSFFVIRPSSHPGRLRTQVLGTTFDDPSITADFDGDGLTDFAVFRRDDSGTLLSHALIRLNASGGDRDYITGANSNGTASGDYNGDGVADIANVQSLGGAGSYLLFDGLTGTQFATVTHGSALDQFIDGNFVGNSVDDLTTANFNNPLQWAVRDLATGIEQPVVLFGVGGDFTLNGDYDGDGLDDISYWRPGNTPGSSKFSIRPSSNPGMPIDIPMGVNGDFPIGNARVH